MKMQIEKDLIVKITKEVINKMNNENNRNMVVAGVSNRHVHLSREHVNILFGQGYTLTKYRDLRQPHQYAAKEVIGVATVAGFLEKVRILGPIRKETQFELSASDARKLKIDPPLVKSGSCSECSPVTLIGPKGNVVLETGLGIAWRHLHLSEEEGLGLGLNDGDEIDVEVPGDRGIIFRKVWVRVGSNMLSEFHVDTDEANACGLKTGDMVRLVL
jgi:putative phosphotransacetylase